MFPRLLQHRFDQVTVISLYILRISILLQTILIHLMDPCLASVEPPLSVTFALRSKPKSLTSRHLFLHVNLRRCPTLAEQARCRSRLEAPTVREQRRSRGRGSKDIRPIIVHASQRIISNTLP